MSALRAWLAFFFAYRGRLSLTAFRIGLALVAALCVLLAGALRLILPGEAAIPLALMVAGTSAFAMITRRLHDRDRSFWPGLLLAAPLGLAGLSHFSGVFPEEGLNAITLYWLAMAAGVGLWLFRDIGLNAGVPGGNVHGPDPLDRLVA